MNSPWQTAASRAVTLGMSASCYSPAQIRILAPDGPSCGEMKVEIRLIVTGNLQHCKYQDHSIST